MPRGKMSPEAKAKIAAAQRKRWAAHRAAKDAGTLPATKKRGRKPGRPAKASTTATGARRGRPPKAAASSGPNPFMDMTIHALVAAKRNVEEAWNATLAMLGMGEVTAKGKGRRGRRKKK